MNLENKDREEMNFSIETQKYFNFLVEDYNFKCVHKDLTKVQYENDWVEVNIYHGRSTYELGVEIGLLEREERECESYLISEIMRLTAPQEEKDFMRPIAKDAVTVKKGVQRMSELLKKYGDTVLRGNRESFIELSEQRMKMVEDSIDEDNLNRTRPQANLAFQQKDYKKAVYLFKSISEHLTPAELKKYIYAKKQIK